MQRYYERVAISEPHRLAGASSHRPAIGIVGRVAVRGFRSVFWK